MKIMAAACAFLSLSGIELVRFFCVARYEWSLSSGGGVTRSVMNPPAVDHPSPTPESDVVDGTELHPLPAVTRVRCFRLT